MQEEDKKYVNMRNFVFVLLTGAALVAVAVTYFSRQNEAAEGQYMLASAPAVGLSSAAQARETGFGINATQILPSFDVVRISRGGTGVIAGRAAPRSNVQVIADRKTIGSVVADNAGEWVLIIEEPLNSGPAELSLRAMRSSGEESQSSDVVVISVPESRGERFVESVNDGVVAVLTPRNGEGASRILQKPGISTVGDIGSGLSIDAVDYGQAGKAQVSGRAAPRARVALYVDNEFIGSVQADEQGSWSLEKERSIAEGSHLLRADQVVDDGDVELRIELPFETDMPTDLSRQSGKVMVKPGNSLWHIARKIYGSGFRYTVIFQQNAEQIRDPDLIYPGQLFTLPKLPRSALNHHR